MLNNLPWPVWGLSPTEMAPRRFLCTWSWFKRILRGAAGAGGGPATLTRGRSSLRVHSTLFSVRKRGIVADVISSSTNAAKPVTELINRDTFKLDTTTWTEASPAAVMASFSDMFLLMLTGLKLNFWSTLRRNGGTTATSTLEVSPFPTATSRHPLLRDENLDCQMQKQTKTTRY